MSGMSGYDRAWYERGRRGKGDTYGQIIRGGMESDESAVGGGSADNYADDAPFSGNDGLDEAYDYDFFKADGGQGRRFL